MGKLREGEALLVETMRQHQGVPDLAERGANSAILSMRLAMELAADDKRCLAVGLCGLLHDLGMLKVSEEAIRGKRLDEAGIELLKRHPSESQRILEDFGPAFAWVGRIVVQVHERRDGSGYPRGLSSEEVHEIAQLVGLADTYLAMAHPRADRPALVVYNVLKEVIDMRRTIFDTKLVKAFINIVSIFPLGSLVKLNNNEIGRVIGTSQLHPTRPKVEILLDSRGRPQKPPRQMILEEEPMVYIVNPAIAEGVLKK
jgi:HD-GYP domain-containing protein (c-di-GMP phosphodiesterase class II)